MFGKKKEADKLSQYEDPIGGFSSRDLRLATWYVRHKDQLRAIFVIFFILVDIALVGYGFWGWAEYAIVGYRQDQVMLANQIVEIEDYRSQQVRYAARDIQYASPEMYENGTDRYDFVIDAQNPNDAWVAYVTYQFVYSSGATESQTVAIMPGSRQPLVSVGVSSSVRPGAVRFEQLDVRWRSINPHVVPDPAEYLGLRNTFSHGEVTFFFASDDNTGGHRVIFDVTNESVFSYWAPQFLVELRDGKKREGVILVTLDEFGAEETETVNIQLFAEQVFVSDVVLYPLVDFFDAGEYMN